MVRASHLKYFTVEMTFFSPTLLAVVQEKGRKKTSTPSLNRVQSKPLVKDSRFVLLGNEIFDLKKWLVKTFLYTGPFLKKSHGQENTLI